MSYLKTTVVGYLGSDARVNVVNGKEVINFSIAHGEKYKNAQGVQMERTLWVSCSYWPEKSTIAQYLKKGTMVLAEGKPDVSIYMDKMNKAQAEFKLRVNTIQLLGGGKQEGQQQGNSGGYVANQQSNSNSNIGDNVEPLDDLPF